MLGITLTLNEPSGKLKTLRTQYNLIIAQANVKMCYLICSTMTFFILK